MKIGKTKMALGYEIQHFVEKTFVGNFEFVVESKILILLGVA